MIRITRLAIVTFFLTLPIVAQDSRAGALIVQPGAPGQPTKVLPATTRAVLAPVAAKDAEFMQGMIHHHAQAVEMTALIEERTTNKELRLLGARISHSQAEEIRFMERWLALRGEPMAMQMPKATGGHEHHHMPGMDMKAEPMLMPGMLTPKQMDALSNAKGKEFDQLFLTGMIQHHEGALVMVKELFDSAGAGQEAEIFNFATDVDSGQRAEIKRMQTLLVEKP
ncbi:MAG: DUF305 domain-containing protein [Pyrinomonadaceae bacterium]|nr:DUF305 domain-containing protein [Pyrinomonadaceae bacterium]